MTHQDFAGQILRGRSFKGQNLEGANFSYADIRGSDFTGAILDGANFSNAQAGLQQRWKFGLILVSFYILGILGIFSGFLGYIVSLILDSENPEYFKVGVTALIVPAVFFLISVFQGLITGSIVGAIIGTLVFTIALAFAAAASGTFAVAFTVFVAVSFAGAFVFAGTFTVINSKAVAIAVVGFGFALTIAVAFAIANALTIVVTEEVVKLYTHPGIKYTEYGSMSGEFAVCFALSATLLSSWIGWRTLKGDKKDDWIYPFAVAFGCTCGTSFRNATLTNANFTKATLKHTDFREANLICTCFYETKELDFIRPGATYLKSSKLRQLLSTGKGMNQNFNGQNLQGVNLQGAILVRTNFERANLSKANLTGSCIQDWIITKSTKLDDIVCDYVYLKWVDGDKRDQMPPRGNFKKGAFRLFVNYILETIDIYHNRDINPRLALTVLKKMSKDYDEPLDIVAVGKRGDKVFIKIKLSETVQPEDFKENYFSRYEDGLKLISSSSKALPSVDELVENKLIEIASDTSNEISSINVTHIEYLNTPKDLLIQGEITVETIEIGGDSIHQSGSFGVGVNKGEIKNVGQVGFMSNNPGGISVGGSVGGNINNVQSDNNKVVQGDTSMTGDRNINTGGGNYNERIERDYIQGNYYAAGQPPSLAEAAAEIQLLLKQLEQTYPTTTTSQQMVVAAEAINRIESNPTLKKRVINAVKEGGLAAFEKALDNPAGAFIVGAIKGWQEVEAQD